MNKHGQTLILFVILIPILLLLAALVVDTGVVFSKKVQVKEVMKEGIKEALINHQDIDAIKEMLVKNNIDVTNLEVEFLDSRIEMKNQIEVNSIFASIIGIKKYTIKINIVGYKDDDKIIFESLEGE